MGAEGHSETPPEVVQDAPGEYADKSSAEVRADDPLAAPLLRRALALREASLVILRPRVLCEFKTEELGRGLQRYVEHGHVSWQIGEFSSHHCHLSVEKVDRVVFAAEATSCQGGRLNYTVWFEITGDEGNPYRPGGYFSITLNRPYEPDGTPRPQVIEPMFELWREFEGEDWVTAEPTFLESCSAFGR